MAETLRLRERLARPPIVVAPGIYDALTALIATQAGFAYVSGAAIAYSCRPSGYRPCQHERSGRDRRRDHRHRYR